MDGYVLIAAPQGGFQLAKVEGLRATIIAYLGIEELGERIAILLNREGMVDVPAGPLERAVEAG